MPKLKAKIPPLHYPENTEGSYEARNLRERTNQIDDRHRADLFALALKRVYGEDPVKRRAR